MIPVRDLVTNAFCRLNQLTNRTIILPLLVFYPTSRCNSRCISCEWWRSTGADDLTWDEIETLVASLPSLGTKSVVLSGGEPLLRDGIAGIAELFHRSGARTWLLTNGLLLRERAEAVAHAFDHVTVSLDASTAALYQRVRGVDGLHSVEAGVRRLREIAPHLPVTARATLHRANYYDLPAIVDKAKAMALDSVSFLAADVSSRAYGRRESLDADESRDLLLTDDDVAAFEVVVAEAATLRRDAFDSAFVAQRVEDLKRLPRYYAAIRGKATFPHVRCNAPWFSVVVEADGTVRPCYFHRSVGNVREKPLRDIIREDLPGFREELNVSRDPICQRCTCSLHAGLRSNVWQGR